MPINYKSRDEQVALKQYVRFSGITIHNPLVGTPTVQFQRERVTVMGDETKTEPVYNGIRGVSLEYDPDADIVLLNPATLEPTGQTMKQGAVYLALFSAAIAADKKADADQAAAEADVARREAKPPATFPDQALAPPNPNP